MPETPTPSGGGGPSAPPWLKAKTFGMPRWVFLGLMVGALGVGLYLRSRAKAAEEVEDEAAVPSEEIGAEGLTLDEQGAGVLAGGATGSVIPVSAPVIPEGFTDVFAGLGSIIETQSLALSERQMSSDTSSMEVRLAEIQAETDRRIAELENAPFPDEGGGVGTPQPKAKPKKKPKKPKKRPKRKPPRARKPRPKRKPRPRPRRRRRRRRPNARWGFR